MSASTAVFKTKLRRTTRIRAISPKKRATSGHRLSTVRDLLSAIERNEPLSADLGMLRSTVGHIAMHLKLPAERIE